MERDELLARHRKVMPSWVSLYYDDPIELVSGRGCYVFDSDGNRYLDFFGGILTTMTGHSVPEVVDAVVDQASRLLHSSTAYLISPMVELAERISKLSGIDKAKVFFTTSGTEANDTALLLASCHRNSNNFLAVRGSYHGRSLSSMAITGNASYSTSSFYPFNVSYILGGSRVKGIMSGLADQQYIDRGVEDLRDLISNGIGTKIAALIAEPIQGVAGFVVPPDGYFGRIKEVLDPLGVLFISDEVQTGWGRTGDNFWGYQAHGVVPDLITFAKGLGNGLSLAGVIGTEEVVESLGGASISTFGGNQLSTRAGLANLNYLLDHDLQSNAKKVGDFMISTLRSELGNFSSVADIRGKGLMIGIEFVEPGSKVASVELTNEVHNRCKDGGLLVGKGGSEGNVLRIAPPMEVSQDEARQGVEILIKTISTVLAH